MVDTSDISIVNFRKVTDWLYRGGQPTLDDVEALSEAGFKTILCLRWNPRAIEAERKRADELGLNFVYMPLSYWVLPRATEIETFFRIIDDAENHPVFVHCKHGRDRTGMLISFYRIAREGWSAHEAYKEMRDAGFHKVRMHHFKWAVYLFARRYKRLLPESTQEGTGAPS